MRRLIREGNPPSGQLASPVPQYWNPSTEAFEDVLGAHGAPRSILYGPNGQPIGSSNPLPVADSALAQAVAQLATEGKLEEARALLETISQKDFATQTTLSEVLQRLEAIEEQLETGDAKVQLKGSVVVLATSEEGITVTANSAITLYSGNLLSLPLKEVSVQWYAVNTVNASVYITYYRFPAYTGAPYGVADIEQVASGYRSIGRWTEVVGPYFRIQFQNNNPSDVTLHSFVCLGRLL